MCFPVDSAILSTQQLHTLRSWLGGARHLRRLLYRATRHGVNKHVLAAAIVGQGPTLTVAKLAGVGALVGCYAHESWSVVPQDDRWHLDRRAFVFESDPESPGNELRTIDATHIEIVNPYDLDGCFLPYIEYQGTFEYDGEEHTMMMAFDDSFDGGDGNNQFCCWHLSGKLNGVSELEVFAVSSMASL